MRSMKRPLRGPALAGTLLLLVAGCQSSTGDAPTGLRVASTWYDTSIDQLEYSITTSDGTAVHPAERRPQVAGGPLDNGIDVVIFLPPQMGGEQIRCQVAGYARGALVRRGQATLNVVGGSVSDVVVQLLAGGGPPPPVDGGTDPDPNPGKKPDAGVPDTAAPPDLAPPTGTKENGKRCETAGECASGNCVDGVCCGTASCAVCHACNVATGPGTCQPVPAGMNEPRALCPVQPANMCGTNGTCNGAGACATYPDGTVCRPGRTCNAGVCR